MTEPSQYFKGRTVQEQMNEVIGYVDVRSAEVATNAIAADVARVHQDMLDADADATAAAASAAAAAGTLANAVKKTGEASQSITGDIAVSGALTGGSISAGVGGLGVGGHSALQDVTVSGNISVPTPTANEYAANKKYVDDADALKADKTYVDNQDATKISITDINNYALGLTGNQISSGLKTFYGITIKRNTPGLDFIDEDDASNATTPPSLKQTILPFRSNDDSINFLMQFIHNDDGSKWLQIACYAENGTLRTYRVCGVDANGNQLNPQWLG